ncbi:MAG: hypothetical protein U0I22_01460 [Treponema sp.]|nr:hypothetical protein [Treponema sp.]
MKSKIKTILVTILVFSLLEFVVYITCAIWDIEDGLSGNRTLNEQEFSDISTTLNDYFNNQESKPYKWELTLSYFAKAIYNDPIPNQYVVYVVCFYENEKIKYSFTLLRGKKKYHIDTVEQVYFPSE